MRRSFSAICLFLCVIVAVTSTGLAAEFEYTKNVQKVVLDNGLTLLLKENPAYDIIAASILTKVGSVNDPEGLEGLTTLTQRNLLSGTTSRTAQDIIAELEALGVQMQTTATYDYSGIIMQATPNTFEESLSIVLDMIENSTFPEAELERERSLSLALLQSLYDDPTNALVLTYLDVFYGNHPYKYSPYGSGEGLSAIQRDDLVNWNQYLYQPEQVVVSVVGSFDTAQLLPLLKESFGSWENRFAGSPVPRGEVPFVYPEEDRQVVLNLPTEAAFLILGYPAPDTFDEDATAMAVINSILGEGMSSRLFTEIRDKRGLAYTAVSQYVEYMGPSNILTFLATHPSNVDAAREQVLTEIKRFADEGLTEEEIAWVAGQKRGAYVLQNETNLNQSIMLASVELLGWGYEFMDEYMSFWESVTPDQIKAVAQKYFQNYTEVLITP